MLLVSESGLGRLSGCFCVDSRQKELYVCIHFDISTNTNSNMNTISSLGLGTTRFRGRNSGRMDLSESRVALAAAAPFGG